MSGLKRWLGHALALILLISTALVAPAAPAGKLDALTVEVLGVPLLFSTYTVYDENGYATNYIKLRDVAWGLQYTSRRFNVDYDGSTVITTGAEYQLVGGEVTYPTAAGSVQSYTAVLTVDGVGARVDALLITEPGQQDGSFYYKLRDLGEAIGFGVGWSPERGVYLETEE